MGRQPGHEGPTLQTGPEPTTTGSTLPEMASLEAKDSPLVHFISLKDSDRWLWHL